MFGINDNKTAGQDPVMPQPLESDQPDTDYGETGAATTAPSLSSSSFSPPAAIQKATPSAGSTYSLPGSDEPQPYPPAADQPTTPVMPAPTGTMPDKELLQIKQEALHSLAPLIGQLDQTPEEKFKTTMMMLQASDNPELVKEAYAAANEIKDEKARAQALLDVVNEINYFTSHEGAA